MIEKEDIEGDIDVFEQTGPAKPAETARRLVALPRATTLSVEEADALLRWRSSSLVAVVGERNGGKTTLVTELYERFLRGPFAGTLFTHSLSLLGFEKKSFLSRAESGADRPDTPRTSVQDGLNFFHLAVSDETDLRRADLLISERAGEAYRNVRNRPAKAKELVEVRKAQTVALILDGERVLDDFRRPEAFASLRHIARAFADQGVLRPGTRLQAVTTKCDLLRGDGAATARDALLEFETRFVASYSDRFAGVDTYRTAARDPTGRTEPAHGLAPLLRSWLQPIAPAPTKPPPPPPLTDEFDRLLLRRAVR